MNDSTESSAQASRAAPARWLLLIHQLPPRPDYLRVKVRRRLHRLGAVPLKQSVYVLPASESGVEDFQWLRGEIVADGGEATVCEAVLLDGVTDGEMEELFRRDRAARYLEIAGEARARLEAPGSPAGDADPALRRLRARLQEVVEMDGFETPDRAEAEAAIAGLEARGRRGPAAHRGGRVGGEAGEGRTWVTRRDVHVDRIASAWLIRRFIDPRASFRFVPARGYRASAGEVRFDMYDGEYTHEGDRCTFETLLSRFHLDDPALGVLGEIVHDLDLKEERYGHPETAGVAAMIGGVVRAHGSDEARLERGAALLDDLLAFLRLKPGLSPPPAG